MAPKKKRKAIKLAFTGQKGGVGKSTLAMNVSAALSILGYKILIIDTDVHQGSIRDACYERNDKNVSAICIKTKDLVREIHKPELIKGFDIVIIDGEGHMHESSRMAIEASDYFIVPVQPSQFDLSSFASYINSVINPVAMYKDISGGVVLSRTSGTASARDARNALQEYPVPIFEIDIPESESLRQAAGMGMCISELRPGVKASRIFFEFLVELCEAASISTFDVDYKDFIELIDNKNKEDKNAEKKKHLDSQGRKNCGVRKHTKSSKL